MYLSTTLQFTLIIICLLIFLKGYFPIKHNDPFIVDPPTFIDDHRLNLTETYRPSIDRLIFIVIDALREDFVTEENMPYTSAVKSCSITVKVEAPTVTLPRIKAMTTGDVPQFADIVLNLGAASKCYDGFLHRARDAGKRMVFYGDDTWIKIYPEMFLREEGTSSFYVTDFSEVDENVTRHLDDEIRREDWDILFLHYLGLDHIGHVRGPFSTLVKPKLREMDDVIATLHKASKKWTKQTLILITGDHGMKDSGGHGGTTRSETHVPLISLGPPCSGDAHASQTDIPTTLSALFGINMPGNGIGKVIPDFFTGYSTERLLYIMRYNLLVLQKHSDKCGNLDEIVRMHRDLLKSYGNVSAEEILGMYKQCLTVISNDLIQSSVEQNLNLLIFSLITSIACFFVSARDYLLTRLNYKRATLNTFTLLVTTLIGVVSINHDVIFVPITGILMFVAAVNFVQLIKTVSVFLKRYDDHKIFFVPLVIHGILMQSSSFVEEEHQICYFCTGTVSLLLFYNDSKNFLATVGIIAGLRFLRTLNSTGDQWASSPDLEDWFLTEHNFVYLQTFHATALLLVFKCLGALSNGDKTQHILYAGILTSVFLFKMYLGNFVVFAKAIWLFIIVGSVREMWFPYKTPERLTIIWILIVSLLLRPHNTILIPACVAASHVYTNRIKNVDLATVTHTWLGYTLFFCQGHSNSIASIDLAPSYIGLSSYVPVLVFLFTLCHTYAFPVLSLLLLLRKHSDCSEDIFLLNVINRVWVLIVVYVLVFIQRGHLFVWSVFAPKLLIESVHTIVLFVQVCFYCTIQYVSKKLNM